jgi:hypothetical protein
MDFYEKVYTCFMGLLGNVNDSKVLHTFVLQKNVQYNGLFETNKGFQHGFPPYLLGDKGYPLISWIMKPFKEEGHKQF